METFLNQPHLCKFHARPFNNSTDYDYQELDLVCQDKIDPMGITIMKGA